VKILETTLVHRGHNLLPGKPVALFLVGAEAYAVVEAGNYAPVSAALLEVGDEVPAGLVAGPVLVAQTVPHPAVLVLYVDPIHGR
jgi:hypothetical protein